MLLVMVLPLKGNIHRNKLIGCLNSSCYLNLLMLSISHLYWQNNTRGQSISIGISIDIAFTLLLGVLIYHTIKTLLEISCLNRFKMHILQRIQNLVKNRPTHPQDKLTMQTMPPHAPPPSFTEVGLSDSREGCTNEYSEEHNTSESSPQLSTTKWKERDSLQEPLLYKENTV